MHLFSYMVPFARAVPGRTSRRYSDEKVPRDTSANASFPLARKVKCLSRSEVGPL